MLFLGIIFLLGVLLFSLSFIYFLYKLMQYPMITINGQSNLLENIKHLLHSHSLLLPISILVGYLLIIIAFLIGLINIIVQIYNDRNNLNKKNIIVAIILALFLSFLLPATFKVFYNAYKNTKIQLNQKRQQKKININECKIKFFRTIDKPQIKIEDPEIIKTLVENSQNLQEDCASVGVDVLYKKNVIENLYKLLKGKSIESLNLGSNQLNEIFVAAVELKINRLFYPLSSYMALSRTRLESLIFEYYDYHRVNILNIIIKALFSDREIVFKEIDGNFDKKPIATNSGDDSVTREVWKNIYRYNPPRLLASYNKNKNNNLMIFNLVDKKTDYLDGNYTSDLKITPDNKYIITFNTKKSLKGARTYAEIIELANKKVLKTIDSLGYFKDNNLIYGPNVLSRFHTQNLAIAPNGNFFVTKFTEMQSDYYNLIAYDIPTGKPKCECIVPAAKGPIVYNFKYSPLIISPDSKTIIAIGTPIYHPYADNNYDTIKQSYKPSIVLMDAQTGKINKTIEGNFGTKSLAITPDNKYIIASGPESGLIEDIGGLHIIDISTGKTKQIISGIYNAQDIKTTPDSKYVLSINSKHGELVIVNLENEKDIKRIHENFAFQKIAVAEHSGYYSKYAITVNSDTHNLAIVDIETGEVNYFEGNFYNQDIILKGQNIISVDLSYSKNNNFISRTWNYVKNLFSVNNPIKLIDLNLAIYRSVIKDTIVHNSYKFSKSMKNRLYNQLTEDQIIFDSVKGNIIHKNYTERIGKQTHRAMLEALRS